MKTGIDVFLRDCDSVLTDRAFALATGGSTIDEHGVPVYRAIREAAGKRLKALWSLQHGFFTDRQDNMILSESFYWTEMDVHVRSLYGERLEPAEDWLDGLDALVVDVFDVGTRVYTFINHLIMVMKKLSGRNIDMIVLDRPNPLSGINPEGNLPTSEYFSIVGQIPCPMRHCLTVGEYLGYAQHYYDLDVQLEIIQVPDWNREQPFSGIWTYPSPNMPTWSAAAVYPGAVMLEGANLSEARGCTRPFEMMGAPFLDHTELIRALENLELPGVRFIPVFFKPEFNKFASQVCKGVLTVPTDFSRFRSFHTFYEILRLTRNRHPLDFQWKQPPYEFELLRPPIDMICGGPFIREAIEANLPFTEIEPVIHEQLLQYMEEIQPFLLY